jgi:hypothetical protein
MPSGPGIVLSFTGLTLMTALFSTASAGPPLVASSGLSLMMTSWVEGAAEDSS